MNEVKKPQPIQIQQLLYEEGRPQATKKPQPMNLPSPYDFLINSD